MRDNYNACTPLLRRFVIVMGEDKYGWTSYDIMATSLVSATDFAERKEIRRRKMLDLERNDERIRSAGGD